MRSPHSFVNFFRAISAEWLTLMSGAMSVPLAIATVYVQNPTAKIGLVITAISCLLVASYRTWRVERLKVSELEQRLSSDIKGPNTSQNPLSMNFFNDNRHNIVKLIASGTVQRQIRLSVRNDGNGWLSNCELRIEDAAPRLFDLPYLLEKGFSLQKGGK